MDSIHWLTHVRVSFLSPKEIWGIFCFTKYFLYLCPMIKGFIMYGVFAIGLYFVDKFIEKRLKK